MDLIRSFRLGLGLHRPVSAGTPELDHVGPFDPQMPAVRAWFHRYRWEAPFRPGRRVLFGLLVFRERDAQYLRILRHEPDTVLLLRPRDPPEGPACDLFAQEAAPEPAESQEVGDGPGVPSLGEHVHRDDAADVLSWEAGFPDRVHHPAYDFLRPVGVGEVVLGIFLVDLRQFPDVPARFPGGSLSVLHLAVDYDGVWVAADLVPDLAFVVAQQGRHGPAGDMPEHGVGVLHRVHHDGHDRSLRSTRLNPSGHRSLVVLVEGVQRLLEERVVARHVRAEVVRLLGVGVAVYVPELRVVGPVGGRWHPGYLGQAGLDGVYERVVRDDPVEGPRV